MNSTTHCIGLLDDDRAFLRALKRLLSSAGYHVLAWTSAHEFCESPSRSRPHCLLVDIDMPGMNGLDFHKYLAQDNPAMPVVFLTGKGSIPAAVRAMKQGAVNYLTKPVAEEELFPVIEAAIEIGQRERSKHAKAAMAKVGLDKLTPREKQVMTHLLTGKLNKQIAAELGTGEQTIKVHRMRVLHKMGVRSLAELVHLAALLEIQPENAP